MTAYFCRVCDHPHYNRFECKECPCTNPKKESALAEENYRNGTTLSDAR